MMGIFKVISIAHWFYELYIFLYFKIDQENSMKMQLAFKDKR